MEIVLPQHYAAFKGLLSFVHGTNGKRNQTYMRRGRNTRLLQMQW